MLHVLDAEISFEQVRQIGEKLEFWWDVYFDLSAIYIQPMAISNGINYLFTGGSNCYNMITVVEIIKFV